jgi:tRNA-intron endonuclease
MQKKPLEDSAFLSEDKAIIEEKATASRLEARGYGKKDAHRLVLDLMEALLLNEISGLKVFRKNKELSFNELMAYAEKQEKQFSQKYLVFSDLRKRGYLVKTGFKFGFDFRVYPKGKAMDESHTESVIQVIPETRTLSLNDFSRMVRMAQTLKTSLVLAVIDNENNISYFKTERILL